jgi:hypothetical protein
MDLPNLIGTPKQIRWAETFRTRILSELNLIYHQMIHGTLDKSAINEPLKMAGAREEAEKLIAAIKLEQSAKFWIDLSQRAGTPRYWLATRVDRQLTTIPTPTTSA